MRIALPWPTAGLDPHAIDDAVSALFGALCADTLFATDGEGRVYPALADGMPEAAGKQLRVRLRPNLVTARGRPLDARDVLSSLNRAAKSGASGPLSALSPVRADPQDPLSIRVNAVPPARAAELLALGVTAILPRGFSPKLPDGTGPFRVDVERGALACQRNLSAARGAAFLDSVHVRATPDLSESLRAFEAGETELSWLGQYLHKPRVGAQKLHAEPFGWVVLFSGDDAGSWGAPGVAQQLLDGIPKSQLTHLGVEPLASSSAGASSWGGEPTEILAPDDAPQLIAIARQLASVLGRPRHELRAAARPALELAYRIRTGRFALRVGFVRRLSPSFESALWSLTTAIDPQLARKPPTVAGGDLRKVTRGLRAGIVGQLRISGAHAGGLVHVAQWELGAVFRKRP
jgi:peptide/nickel transport system substrate-binding protein